MGEDWTVWQRTGRETMVEPQLATDARVSAVIRRGMIVVGDPQLAGALDSALDSMIAAVREEVERG